MHRDDWGLFAIIKNRHRSSFPRSEYPTRWDPRVFRLLFFASFGILGEHHDLSYQVLAIELWVHNQSFGKMARWCTIWGWKSYIVSRIQVN